jgi:hypothetical protein
MFLARMGSGRHLADQRQAVFFRLHVLFFEQQTNAAGRTRHDLDDPFLARAFRCSSAALADLKPSFWAISARVGGMPVSFMFALISSSTSAWRG